MNISRFGAGASRFAHLTGLARMSSRAAAEDDQSERDDARAEDDDGDEDQPKGKRSKKAEDDDDQPKGKRSRAKADDTDQDDDDQPKGKGSKAKAEDDDDDDGDEPKARGKRSKADDSDDDDDDDDKKEMTGRGAVASARLRERERCAAIFSSKAAARNPALAASLAFDTTMTRQEAITVLKGQASSARDDDDDDAPRNRHARSDRSSRNVRLGGSLPEQGGKQAVTSSWDSAFKKAGIATVPR